MEFKSRDLNEQYKNIEESQIKASKVTQLLTYKLNDLTNCTLNGGQKSIYNHNISNDCSNIYNSKINQSLQNKDITPIQDKTLKKRGRKKKELPNLTEKWSHNNINMQN